MIIRDGTVVPPEVACIFAWCILLAYTETYIQGVFGGQEDGVKNELCNSRSHFVTPSGRKLGFPSADRGMGMLRFLLNTAR